MSDRIASPFNRTPLMNHTSWPACYAAYGVGLAEFFRPRRERAQHTAPTDYVVYNDTREREGGREKVPVVKSIVRFMRRYGISSLIAAAWARRCKQAERFVNEARHRCAIVVWSAGWRRSAVLRQCILRRKQLIILCRLQSAMSAWPCYH